MSREDALSTPAGQSVKRNKGESDWFGNFTEWIARAMGTPTFLLILTLFCVAWLLWNTLAPQGWRFDSAANGFTALTLMLSLQASYSAPLILLAQNRQADRDRVMAEQDRQIAERNLADTEYLARELVALRMLIEDTQSKLLTKDHLRDAIAELREQEAAAAQQIAEDKDAIANDERISTGE